MASVIANCLARLVRAGRVSQKAADAAMALHEGMQGQLWHGMGPIHGDAASAIAVARAMAEAAHRRKYEAAKDVLAKYGGEERMAAHTRGESAGLSAMLQFDVWADEAAAAVTNINVESHAETILGRLFKRVGQGFEPYRSRMAGFRQDTIGIRNVIRERYGTDTGDPIAKAGAAAWRSAVDEGVLLARRGGKDFSPLEDWRFPQHWERIRVRKFRGEFVDEILAEVDAGTVSIMDKMTGLEATRLQAPAIVRRAMDDIIHGTNRGASGRGFQRDMRVFRINDAESWLRLNDKYGSGAQGLYGMMIGHMRAMAREIALIDVLGPNHGAVFNTLLKVAQRSERGGKVARTLTGARMAELAYKDQSGQLSAVKGDLIGGIFGGLRNIKTATSLGSAVISAIPGDTITTLWAARANGIPAVRVLTRAVNLMVADNATKRELAAQMGIVSHAVTDATLGSRRFEDQVVGSNWTGRLASSFIRVSGLQAWTEGLKRSFSMEFHGVIARQADHAWENLDPAFQGFLRRYGFIEADWVKLRETPPLEIEGARFFDTEAAGALGKRLNSAIIDERHFAVIEPTALVRAVSSAGQARGTIAGEVSRSSFMFKSFAMTILITHVMRAATKGPWHQRVFRTSAFIATMTLAGAASLQAKQILAGRDPRSMQTPQFWWAAFAQGGGAGIYGDLVYSATTRGGQGFWSTVAGPVLGEIPGTIDVFNSIAAAGDYGAALARYVKRWTPGSTLWFARLAIDREIFDFIHSMLDEGGANAAARRQRQTFEREFGQDFWFSPGTRTPDRTPDLGAAIPN